MAEAKPSQPWAPGAKPAPPAKPVPAKPAAQPAAPAPAAQPPATPPPPAPAAAPEAPAEPAAAEAKPEKKKANRPLQILIETISILSFLALAFVPLARFNLVPIRRTEIDLILVLSSVLLTAGALLFESAGYGLKRRSIDDAVSRGYQREMMLTILSVGGTFVVALMLFLEFAALFAFLGLFVDRNSAASVAFAENYVLFATFTLLFCSMLLIVRTSFETRATLVQWKKVASWTMLSFAALLAIITILVTYQVLDQGVFAAISARQSIYILTLGVLLQIIAFKVLLHYPAIAKIVTKEIDAARRANKELRDEIQKRALRAYFGGLAFVLLSMFLLGGIATQNLPVQDSRQLNFIVFAYVSLGLVIMGIVLTRYFQHRYIEARKRRAAQGDIIAKKRPSRAEINLRVMYIFSATFGSIFFIVGVLVLLGRIPGVQDTYGTDLLILAFLTGVGPYGWHRGRAMKRINAMDDKFPDFLRDLAESERAGMTLPRALKTASKGVYGALTKEIKHMNAQVEWGVSFSDALQRFSKRVNTPLIERTVALIVEASKAGGNVIDILTAASDDAREIKQILEERHRQMGIYGMIIYISFFVFLVVVFILAAQFLPAFHAAAGASTGAQVSGASIQAFDPEDFETIFFHAALIQGIGGGLVSGIMQQGHPLSGLKHSVIMTLMAWFFFRVLVG